MKSECQLEKGIKSYYLKLASCHIHSYNRNIHPFAAKTFISINVAETSDCIIATETVTCIIATEKSNNITAAESTNDIFATEPQNLHNCNRRWHLDN